MLFHIPTSRNTEYIFESWGMYENTMVKITFKDFNNDYENKIFEGKIKDLDSLGDSINFYKTFQKMIKENLRK